MIQVKDLQQELKQLPITDKLQLAYWLLDSVLSAKEEPLAIMGNSNALSTFADIFENKPEHLSKHVEEMETAAAVDCFLSRNADQVASNQRQAYEQARQIIKEGRQPGEPRILGALAGLIKP
jgi:hypothetical protein